MLALSGMHAAFAADDAAAAAKRIVPNTFVQTDAATLKALVESIKPLAKELGCTEVPQAPSHPMGGKRSMQGKGSPSHGTMKHRGAHHSLPESAFYACGAGPDSAQKFVAAAQEAAGRVLESHPDALVQVGFALTKPSASLAQCTATCQTPAGPKPGFILSGHCFICQ